MALCALVVIHITLCRDVVIKYSFKNNYMCIIKLKNRFYEKL